MPIEESERKMDERLDTKNIGLRGVKVADTRISDVDGERGILSYRGFNIVDLPQSSTFEEVSSLLLNAHLPTQEELKKFQSKLVSERRIPQAVLEYMKKLLQSANPMDILQSAVPILGSYDPQLREETKEANLKKALRLIAKLPSMVAAWDRIRKGKEPVLPHPDLTHAGKFLYMLYGSLPCLATAGALLVL